MTAEIPQRPRTLHDLRRVLCDLSDVIDAAVHHDEALEWRDPWLEVVVDGVAASPELCKEVGRTKFSITDVATQGHAFCVVEIQEVR